MNSERPSQKKGIQSRKVGDEWILYDSENESVHVINSTAEFVWRLCDGSHTVEDMEAKMNENFQIPENTDVTQALNDILEKFGDLGIIV